MQLDPVGCDPVLAVQHVEEPDTADLHSDVDGRERRRGGGVAGGEVGPRLPDRGQEGAGRGDTSRVGDLGDHRGRGRVGEDQVDVTVVFELEPGQPCRHREHGGLGRGDPVAAGVAGRCRQRGQVRHRRGRCGLQIDCGGVGVAAGLHRPPLHPRTPWRSLRSPPPAIATRLASPTPPEMPERRLASAAEPLRIPRPQGPRLTDVLSLARGWNKTSSLGRGAFHASDNPASGPLPVAGRGGGAGRRPAGSRRPSTR